MKEKSDPVQVELFPHAVVPKRFYGPKDDTAWPLSEVETDIKAVDRMTELLRQVSSPMRAKSIANYFIYKYGSSRGIAALQLFTRFVRYLTLYGEDLVGFGLIKEDNKNKSIDFLYLKKLLSALEGQDGSASDEGHGKRCNNET